ncbi:MAG: bifunctional methionine sulfoxide reductase B/A protein [Planctomycetaceae bacterium]
MPGFMLFNKRGELVGPVEAPRVELTDAEWRQRLTPDQFRILRAQGTERPFCGTLLDNKTAGVYCCAGCGLPLFSSRSKFHSGTGWPSFFESIGRGNVAERRDSSHGMVRVEILCARCDGHLGHVFPDGPPPTGRRYCLNSESLQFTPETGLAGLADPATDLLADRDAPAARPQSAGATGHVVADAGPDEGGETLALEIAVLAGGCFWCTEAAFEQLTGVLDVESGYCGGTPETANYKAVCSGATGHAEAIRIRYNPLQITFEQLLEVFLDAHDPTQKNRQGNDVGPQYRSAIFYSSADQRERATRVLEQAGRSGRFPRPVVTTLEPLTHFHLAEDYHQDYARNNPGQPYILYHALPKACEVRKKHPRLVADDRRVDNPDGD